MDDTTLAEALKGWIDGGSEAAQGVDTPDANPQNTDTGQDAPAFDADAFLKGLDAIFDAHEGAVKAEPYLLQAMSDAENAGDDAGLLTVLNETMGFYRSQGRHDDNQWIVQRAIELALRMRLEGTGAWTTTLINAATSMRAASRYDQAEDLYRQAIDSARTTLSPTDRRMAALHNNLSMLYGETGRPAQAERELRAALEVLESASTDPARDVDIAATHTNLALILLDRMHGGARDEDDANARGAAGGGADATTAARAAANGANGANGTNSTNNANGADNADSEPDAAALLDAAMRHARRSLEIYHDAGQEHAGHYASALAGYAQVCLAAGRAEQAVDRYRQALAVIDENYGRDNDYYRITATNLVHAEQAAEQATAREPSAAVPAPIASDMSSRSEPVVPEPSGSVSDTSATPAPGRHNPAPTGSAAPAPARRDSDPTGSAPTGSAASGPVPARPGSPSASPDRSGTAPSRDADRPGAADAPVPCNSEPEGPSGTPTPRGADRAAPGTPRPALTGLKLARAYWNEYGKPLIEERYPEYRGRIAAGLVGHGSECYGFDDGLSHDHDFGPGFCLWLTDEDYAAIGPRLQADYEALPDTFMGFGPRESTARAQGAGRRVGVFAIGDFFESITGYREAPGEDRPHEWLMLDEATLAAATNGEVFADPLGAFSKARQGFKLMPDDVRLSLVSRRLGMIAQAGQYNLPRMLARGDGAAAWCSINEFVEATASLVFLLNRPVTVGYLPYYKWRFAALRRLSRRMSMRLTGVCGQLETVLRLSSAACFGGAGFGEGGRGAEPAAHRIEGIVESICRDIVAELNAEGLSSSGETFLEWQRPHVEEHIARKEDCLISL